MSISSKIALAMSADGASFEEVHNSLEKITNDFAIAFAIWIREETYYEHLTKEFIYKHNVYENEKELLEIFIHDVL